MHITWKVPLGTSLEKNKKALPDSVFDFFGACQMFLVTQPLTRKRYANVDTDQLFGTVRQYVGPRVLAVDAESGAVFSRISLPRRLLS